MMKRVTPLRTYTRKNRRTSGPVMLSSPSPAAAIISKGDTSPSDCSSQSSQDLSDDCVFDFFASPFSSPSKKGDSSFDSDSQSTSELWDADLSFDTEPEPVVVAAKKHRPKITTKKATTPKRKETSAPVKRRNSWSGSSNDTEQEEQPITKKKRTISLPKIVVTGPPKPRNTNQQKRKRSVLKSESSKNSFELQVTGANETIIDELEFNLEGLKPSQPLVVRRGSVLNLAGMMKNYEASLMLRSKGLFGKIFEMLEENPTDKALSLYMATMIYLIFREPRNSEFITEKTVISLLTFMSAITETSGGAEQGTQPAAHRRKVITKEQMAETAYRTAINKVTALLAEDRPTALALEVTASSLALEAMLHLSRNGSVFKEAIRNMNGFGTIHELIQKTMPFLEEHNSVHQQLVGLGRLESYLKLLENVTNSCNTVANQKHLTTHTGGFVATLLKLISTCNELIDNGLSHEAAAIVNTLTAGLRVLINLSNGNEEGCRLLGEHGGLEVGLSLLSSFCSLEENLGSFQLGVLKDNIPEKDKKHTKRNMCFDVQLLTLGLLINLVEKDAPNRERMGVATSFGSIERSPIAYLADLFVQKYNANKADGKVLAEYSVTAAYVALLLGCLVLDNEGNKERVQVCLPGPSFAELPLSLREFIALQSQSGLLSTEALASTAAIIKLLEGTVVK